MKAKLIITGLLLLLFLILSGCATGGYGSGGSYSLRTHYYNSPGSFYYYGYYGDYYRYSPYNSYYYSPYYYSYYPRRYYAPVPRYTHRDSKRLSGKAYLNRYGYNKRSKGSEIRGLNRRNTGDRNTRLKRNMERKRIRPMGPKR